MKNENTSFQFLKKIAEIDKMKHVKGRMYNYMHDVGYCYHINTSTKQIT